MHIIKVLSYSIHRRPCHIRSVFHEHKHRETKAEEGRSKYTCQLVGNKQTHTSPSITENGAVVPQSTLFTVCISLLQYLGL